MAAITLRAATRDDFPGIRRLIHLVGINPTGLDWKRFLIAVDSSGRFLGCGQLKPHGDKVVELASLAVQPEYRGQGVARAIIEQLIAEAPRPLFLTCRAQLGPFYERWGFRTLSIGEMPTYFRRLARLARVLAPLTGGNRLLIMELK